MPKLDKISRPEIHLKIVNLVLENPNITDQELADKIGLSRQTVNRYRNSEAVRGMFNSLLSISENEIRRITVKALKRLETLLDSEDERIRLSAALAFLKFGDKLVTPKIIDNFF